MHSVEKQSPSQKELIQQIKEAERELLMLDKIDQALAQLSLDDGFKSLKNRSINSTFYNAAFYQEAIYIASEQGLYVYADSDYSIVPELSDIQGVISVEEKGGVLWVLSYKHLIRFDGKTWDRISHPDNDER